MIDGITRKLQSYYRRANRATHGHLAVLKDAIVRFTDSRATEAAASMAYYAFFSMFPLLLLLISIGSYFLGNEQVLRQVIDRATQSIPVSEQLIRDTLKKVVEVRGTGSLFGLIGLLWAASNVFATLSYHINSAWKRAKERDFIQQRLVGLAMIGALGLFLAFSLLSSAAMELLATLRIPLGQRGVAIYDTPLWSLVSILTPLVFTFLMFASLYAWVPTVAVSWQASLIGAAVAAVAWQIAVHGFTWYLGSGFASYESVYGPLATVIVLLFWIYIASVITFFGAHLSAALDRRRRERAGPLQGLQGGLG